jgi:hypothetical protein
MCAFVSLAGPTATIIAAVAAVLVAVLVTWRLGKGQLRIAKQQAATARQQAELAAVRLQHDLFDRRFAIYEAAQKLALEVVETANVSREGWNAFIRSTEKSLFLLDKEVTDYLTDMRKRAVNLRNATGKLEQGSEEPGLARERADLSTWFAYQFDVLIEKFKPTLTFDKRQLPATD